jgi:hypothetical protein
VRSRSENALVESVNRIGAAQTDDTDSRPTEDPEEVALSLEPFQCAFVLTVACWPNKLIFRKREEEELEIKHHDHER